MLSLGLAMAASLPALSVIPQPVSVRSEGGSFSLNVATKIVCSRDCGDLGRRLQMYLTPSTGLELPVTARGGTNCITLSIDGKLTNLGDEGYQLVSTPKGVMIRARRQAGIFYGIQTLRQLLPTSTLRKAKSGMDSIEVPCVTIEDQPRFGWRGAHLDVGRHFFPKEFVLKFIDLMALHKLNVFHFHLTEDQGWRIEIKKYPKLTEVGSRRKDTMLQYDPPVFEGKPHGGFYTQEDIREIVSYASSRFITVLPEIEMPGHSRAAIAAYPELGNTGKPIDVGTTWGVIEDVYNVNDSTLNFLKDVLSEVMDLFPSKFIHIGGDECPKVQWKSSPAAQARMKAEGLTTEEQLQSWFIRKIENHINSKGRRMIGWSEILEGGIAPNAALMVWLGDEGAMDAVKSGHDVVMAQTTHTYFDYYQGKDRKAEPHAIGSYLPLERVYQYEPILQQMTSEQATHVLGAQFQLWSEYFPDTRHVEYMAFPRACAMAEVCWSPKSARNFESFVQRLKVHQGRLAAMDVNFRPVDKN